MSARQVALLYSSDPVFVQRVCAYTLERFEIKHVQDPASLSRALDRHSPIALLLDVRGNGTIALLEEIRTRWPDTLVLAFGESRSDPYLAAMDVGVYALQPLGFDGPTLDMMLRQATTHMDVSDELKRLRERQPATAQLPGTSQPLAAGHALPSRQFLQPLRHFDDVQRLLQSFIDGIAGSAPVLRAGIFARFESGMPFRFQAGVGCLDETRRAEFMDDDVLVRWMELNAQIITPATASTIDNSKDRRRLQHDLEELGAELVLPIQGRQRMLGWLLLGRPATGGQFTPAELREVMMLTEHIAASLENAMLYREIALQKSFAETLLQTLPTGVIAANSDGQISWFNDAASAILGVRQESVINMPIETLGGRIAVQLRRCLLGEDARNDTQYWKAANGKQYLAMRVTQLMDGDSCVGAVAFVHDRSRDEMLTRKQRDMERVSLWTDVAANMSHEIRNPMVAIKTFAQLLPERYNDPDLRREFSTLVSREVDRLDAIIQQINSFANQPAPNFEILAIEDVIREAKNQSAYRLPEALDTPVSIAIEPGLPLLRGDSKALAECFTHVFVNAMEALYGKPEPEITLSARAVTSPETGEPAIEVSIRDNAGGIPPSVKQNVFSPFCTTKDRAMGLGLPVAQRIAAAHGGQVTVANEDRGTCVTISLPAQAKQQETMHAALTDR